MSFYVRIRVKGFIGLLRSGERFIDKESEKKIALRSLESMLLSLAIILNREGAFRKFFDLRDGFDGVDLWTCSF